MFGLDLFKSSKEDQTINNNSNNTWNPNTLTMEQPRSPAAPSNQQVVTEQPVCSSYFCSVIDGWVGMYADVSSGRPRTDAAAWWYQGRCVLRSVCSFLSILFFPFLPYDPRQVLIATVQLRWYRLLRVL